MTGLALVQYYKYKSDLWNSFMTIPNMRKFKCGCNPDIDSNISFCGEYAFPPVCQQMVMTHSCRLSPRTEAVNMFANIDDGLNLAVTIVTTRDTESTVLRVTNKINPMMHKYLEENSTKCPNG